MKDKDYENWTTRELYLEICQRGILVYNKSMEKYLSNEKPCKDR